MPFVIDPNWLMSIHWPLLRSVHSHKATKDGWIGRNGEIRGLVRRIALDDYRPLSLVAMHAGVPHLEDAGWVVLPDPGVQRLERRQTVPVGCVGELECLPEEHRWCRSNPATDAWLGLAGFPVGLDHDILKGG